MKVHDSEHLADRLKQDKQAVSPAVSFQHSEFHVWVHTLEIVIFIPAFAAPNINFCFFHAAPICCNLKPHSFVLE